MDQHNSCGSGSCSAEELSKDLQANLKACSNGSCEDSRPVKAPSPRATECVSIYCDPVAASKRPSKRSDRTLCFKCKDTRTKAEVRTVLQLPICSAVVGHALLVHSVIQLLLQVLAKQQEPLCLECFEFSLSRTVRHTIRTKCLIEPGDDVLVALSGGSSSLALLLLLQGIHASKQTAAKYGQVRPLDWHEAFEGCVSEHQVCGTCCMGFGPRSMPTSLIMCV